MIPFSFFVIQQLSSGVVRVNFSNVTWVQDGDVWTYTIPRSTHKSGLYPGTSIVNLDGHVLTGASVEYSMSGDVKLTVIIPVTNFVAYFYGDNTEQPPTTPETFMMQHTNGGVYVRVGEDWFFNDGISTTWQKQLPTFAPVGQYKQMTSARGQAGIVTNDGSLHLRLDESSPFGASENIPISVKKVSIPDQRAITFPYGFYALGENGVVYGRNKAGLYEGIWEQFNLTERITDMAMNGSCLLMKSESNKVYAYGYNAHTEFPYYEVDAATGLYILKRSTTVNDYLYVSEIGQCGITCLFKFVDDGKWYRTGLILTGYSYISAFDGLELNHNSEIPFTYEITSGYGVNIIRSTTNEAYFMKMYGVWQEFKLPELYDGACGSGSHIRVTYMSLADHSAIHKFEDLTVPSYTVIPFPR